MGSVSSLKENGTKEGNHNETVGVDVGNGVGVPDGLGVRIGVGVRVGAIVTVSVGAAEAG